MIFKTETEFEVVVDGEYYWAVVGMTGEVDYTPGVFAAGKTSVEDVRRLSITALEVLSVDSETSNADTISDEVLLAAIPSSQLFEMFWDEWQLDNLND